MRMLVKKNTIAIWTSWRGVHRLTNWLTARISPDGGVCDNARFGNASDCKLRITKSSLSNETTAESPDGNWRRRISCRIIQSLRSKIPNGMFSMKLESNFVQQNISMEGNVTYIRIMKYRVIKYKLKCNTRACLYLYNNRM